MLDLIAYEESQDSSAALVNVAALADEHVRVVGDDIVIPEGRANIGAVVALGATISLARLVSPSLRQIVNPDITPLNIAAEPVDGSIMELWDAPMPLDAGESLNFQAAEGAGGAEIEVGLVWLTDGPINPVTGNIRTIRATNASTLGAQAWTNGALTFGQTLPVGEYDVVGMAAFSAGLYAARLVFQNENPTRPGCVGFDTEGEGGRALFRNGRLGVWGRFHTNAPPTVDFLSLSADSAQVVYLDVVKVS